jgi:hypothetical protein
MLRVVLLRGKWRRLTSAIFGEAPSQLVLIENYIDADNSPNG